MKQIFATFLALAYFHPAYGDLVQVRKEACAELLSRFQESDFSPSTITAHISRPKPGNAEYPAFAVGQTKEALSALQGPQATIEILRQLGLNRKKFGQRHGEDRTNQTGNLVLDIHFSGLARPGKFWIQTFYLNVYSQAQALIDAAQSGVSLEFPDNSAKLGPKEWATRVLHSIRTMGYVEIKPEVLLPDFLGQEHYFHSASSHKIVVSGETFRDVVYRFDLDQGELYFQGYTLAESQRALKAVAGFVDDVRNQINAGEGYRVSTDPESGEAYENFLRILAAEKVSNLASFYTGGSAAVGRSFWSAFWTFVLGKKFVVPADQHVFAITSPWSKHLEEQTAYHNAFQSNAEEP